MKAPSHPIISVIIPVLNEEGRIGRAVSPLLGALEDPGLTNRPGQRVEVSEPSVEVIVVDGGSSDGTVEEAEAGGARVVTLEGSGSDEGALPPEEVSKPLGRALNSSRGGLKPLGRGVQMDAGAAAARGDILLFLHADTTLPPRGFAAIIDTLSSGAEGVVGGAFSLAIKFGGKGEGKVDGVEGGKLPGGGGDTLGGSGGGSGHGPLTGYLLKVVEVFANLRARHLGLIYGDEGIFVRRQAFVKVGGYRSLPLFEDLDLVRRLKGEGEFLLLPDRVETSARRWLKRGVLRTTFKNWFLLVLYFIGVPPERLYTMYYNR